MQINAKQVSYQPGAAANWPVVPAALPAALDELAALVGVSPITSVMPTKGGKSANMKLSPAGNLWVICFGAGGVPSKAYSIEAYDITTTAAKPKLLSSTGAPTFAWFNVEQLAFAGTTLFAVAHSGANSQLISVNVAAPAAPVQLGTLNLAAVAAIPFDVGIGVTGPKTYAVVPVSTAAGALLFIDVSLPAAMVLTSTVQAATSFFGVETGAWPTVYATDGGNGILRVYNATVPAAPTVVGTLALSVNIRRMVLDPVAKKLYVATTNGEQLIRVIDVTNPAAPVQISTIPCGIFGDDTPIHLTTVGGRTILVVPLGGQAVNPGMVQTFDVSNPAAPVFLHGLYLGQNVSDCIVSGSYAYATNRGGAQELIAMNLNPLVV